MSTPRVLVPSTEAEPVMLVDEQNRLKYSAAEKKSMPKINPYSSLVPILLVYYVVLFMIMPLSAQVVISLVCESQKTDDCSSAEVSSEASMISLYSSLALNVPSLLMAGPFQSFADKFGRRSIMFAPMIGLTVNKLCLFLISYYRFSSFIYILVAANFIQGCLGGGGVFQMGIFTYASDITENDLEFRTTLFSILESLLFIAKILGPILGGLWARYRGFSEPLLYGCVLLAAAGLYGFFVIPESLPLDAKVRQNEITFNPTKTVKNLYKMCSLQFDRGKNPIPYVLMGSALTLMVVMGSSSILVFYFTVKFDWSAETLGYYLAIEGGMQTVSMLLLPYIVEKLLKFKIDNVYWIGGGYFFRGLSYLAISLCSSSTQVFLCTLILILTGPYYPRNRVLLSNSVSSVDQATMQSAIAAVDTIGSFAAPLCTLIYSLTVSISPSIVYYVLSFLICFASMIVFYTSWNPDLYLNLPETRDRYHNKDKANESDFDKESKRGGGASTNDRTYSASEPLLSGSGQDVE